MDFVAKLLALEAAEAAQGACCGFLRDAAAEGRQIRLQLWDTAGQERFRALMPSLSLSRGAQASCLENMETYHGGYLRDSSACVVVYDVTSRVPS